VVVLWFEENQCACVFNYHASALLENTSPVGDIKKKRVGMSILLTSGTSHE
jgi:hypothetical protein